MSFSTLLRSKEKVFLEDDAENENVEFVADNATENPEEHYQELYRDASQVDIGTTEAEVVEIQTESDAVESEIETTLETGDAAAEEADDIQEEINENDNEVTESDARIYVERFISFHKGARIKPRTIMNTTTIKRIQNNITVESDGKITYNNPKHIAQIAMEGFKETAWKAYDAVINILRKFMNFIKKTWAKLKNKFSGRKKAIEAAEKRMKGQVFNTMYKFTDGDDVQKFIKMLATLLCYRLGSKAFEETVKMVNPTIVQGGTYSLQEIEDFLKACKEFITEIDQATPTQANIDSKNQNVNTAKGNGVTKMVETIKSFKSNPVSENNIKDKYVKILSNMLAVLEKAEKGNIGKGLVKDFFDKCDAREFKKGDKTFDPDEEYSSDTLVIIVYVTIGEDSLTVYALEGEVDDEDSNLIKVSSVSRSQTLGPNDANNETSFNALTQDLTTQIKGDKYPFIVEPRAMEPIGSVIREYLVDCIKEAKKFDNATDEVINKTYENLNKVMNTLDKLKSKNRVENDNDKDIRNVLSTMTKTVPLVSKGALTAIPTLVDANLKFVKAAMSFFVDRKTLDGQIEKLEKGEKPTN